MDIGDLEPAYQEFVRELLIRAGYEPDALQLAMPSGDEMFFKGILPGYPGRPGAAFYRYMESALRTFDVYRQLADHLDGFERLESVLDFGSGWGRLTRLLVNHLPRERIWVSDLYATAIGWQAETFGVNGLVSVTDPDRFALPHTQSIVFAASVFSHLPNGLFQRWLRRLYALVSPGGMLAFSAHGVGFAPEGQVIAPSGIGYAGWSESGSLDPAIYGMSYVSQDFVARAIRETVGADARFRIFPCALFENQDLYVVAGPELDIDALEVRAAPVAGFAPLRGPAWSGWGVELNPDHQIARANLFIDDRPVASMTPSPDNVDVMKYFPSAPNMPVRWAFDPTPVAADARLRVELISSTGKTASCHARPGVDADRGAARV